MILWNLYKRTRAAWHRRQRRLDIEILWPAIRENARTLDHAKTVFLLHVRLGRDPAWHPANISGEELENIFRGLR